MPTTHGPCIVRATAAGPALHLPEPSSLLVAVGNVNVGPAPQMNFSDPAGEKNSEGLMSPRPKAWSIPGASDGWLMTGMIVRVIRFQVSVSLIGTTGCTFMIQTVRFSGPVLKLKLCWKGTLIRSATGFCVCFARSVSLLSPRTGLTPASTASSRIVPPIRITAPSSSRARPDTADVPLHARRQGGSLRPGRRVTADERVGVGGLEALVQQRGAGGIRRAAGRHGGSPLGLAGGDSRRDRGACRVVARLARVATGLRARGVLVVARALVGPGGLVALRGGRRPGAAGLELAKMRAARRLTGTASPRARFELSPALPQLRTCPGAGTAAALEPGDARVLEALVALLRPGREPVDAARDRRLPLAEAGFERGTEPRGVAAVLLALGARLHARRVAIATQLLREQKRFAVVLPAGHVVAARGLEAGIAAHAGPRERRCEED